MLTSKRYYSIMKKKAKPQVVKFPDYLLQGRDEKGFFLRCPVFGKVVQRSKISLNTAKSQLNTIRTERNRGYNDIVNFKAA